MSDPSELHSVQSVLTYVEFDSTYRDRDRFPSPANFSIPFSRKIPARSHDFIDATSHQISIAKSLGSDTPWNLHALNEYIEPFSPTFADAAEIGQVATAIASRNRESATIAVEILQVGSADNIIIVKDVRKTAMNGAGTTNRDESLLARDKNAYVGCVFVQENPYAVDFFNNAVNLANGEYPNQVYRNQNRGRILEYDYLGHGMAKLKLSSSIFSTLIDPPLANPNPNGQRNFYIQNMSQSGISSVAGVVNVSQQTIPVTSGEIFVPSGIAADEAYANFFVVNETRKQVRAIESYDGDTHLLSVEKAKVDLPTATQGSTQRWQIGDAMSIRIEPPANFLDVGLAGADMGFKNTPGLGLWIGTGTALGVFTFSTSGGQPIDNDSIIVDVAAVAGTPIVSFHPSPNGFPEGAQVTSMTTAAGFVTAITVSNASGDVYDLSNVTSLSIGSVNDVEQEFSRQPSRQTFQISRSSSSSSRKICPGNFLEPLFGNVFARRMYADGRVAIAFTGATAASPARVTVLDAYAGGVQVGDRVVGSVTLTATGAVVDLDDATTVVGIQKTANSNDVDIFLSGQFLNDGTELGDGTMPWIDVFGGGGKAFAVRVSHVQGSGGARWSFLDHSARPTYQDAYVGMRIVVSACSQASLDDPSVVIESTVASYDVDRGVMTVSPPFTCPSADVDVLQLFPKKEALQIEKYADVSGTLVESVVAGSRTIVFPALPSVSRENGFYEGLYITLGDSPRTYETRFIVRYDGSTRTATVSRAFTRSFRGAPPASVAAAPALACEGAGSGFVPSEGEFDTYDSPSPANPYYVPSTEDIGRQVISIANGQNGAPTYLPAGSFLYNVVGGNNTVVFISLPDGTNFDTSLYSAVNSILQLGELRGSQFRINSGRVRNAFTSPLPMNITSNVSAFPQQAIVVGNAREYARSFDMTGTLLEQEQCYKVTLLNLVLPNAILASGAGGKIAFYPYVTVRLHQETGASATRIVNNIITNNPNSRGISFRCPIDDIADPEQASFIKLNSDGQLSTIHLKPNDDLHFSVHLPDGEIFRTSLSDTPSPEIPNPFAQISAIFLFMKTL